MLLAKVSIFNELLEEHYRFRGTGHDDSINEQVKNGQSDFRIKGACTIYSVQNSSTALSLLILNQQLLVVCISFCRNTK